MYLKKPKSLQPLAAESSIAPAQRDAGKPVNHTVRNLIGVVSGSAVAAIGAILMLTAGLADAAKMPLPTVASVDLPSYLGRWYEQASLPNRFQKQCVADTQAVYSLEGEKIIVRNQCRTAEGKIDTIKGSAKVVPESNNAKLKVTFFWPFYGDYWILAFGPNQQWALVGEPDRKYAWVLSRTARLPEDQLEAALTKAAELGFDRMAFKATPQSLVGL